MSTYPPYAIPTLIPGDINVRTSRVSTIYPIEIVGPYTTWKLPVKAATTVNITLENEQIVDGVSLVDGDRILVKNQNTGSTNGIYVVKNLAFWARDNDLEDDSSAANITMFVSQGTISADLQYICTNNSGSDVVGTDSLVFATYGNISLVVPGGSNTNVQYNNSGAFGGSSLFTFNPASTSATVGSVSFPVLGTVTVGPVQTTANPTPPPVSGLIIAPNAVASSGNSGGTLIVGGGKGDGAGAGGTLALIGGVSPTGQGGNASINAGSGSNGGGASLQAGNGTVGGGNVNINGGNGTSTLGGNVVLSAGTSNVTGGNVQLSAGSGTTQGGNIIISSGTSSTSSGNVTVTANAAGTTKGIITFITNSINTNILNGGIELTKDTTGGMTIANLSAPPTITTTQRQGIITITDPSAVGLNSSITITVTNTNVLSNDVVYVCIKQFNTGGTGIPMVLTSSVTTSTGFTIQLYNIGAVAFSASTMKISFVIL
jgi:hypothetical protein